MGLSGAETFTSGFVVVVVAAAIYFVFSEHGVEYFHPFVLFTHLFTRSVRIKGGDDEKSTKLCQECAISET